MGESTLMTAEGVQELRDQLHRLETVERARVVEQIKTAREWGDLKENSEYHAAKDAQSRLETRILRLREKLLTAEVVEAGGLGDGQGPLRSHGHVRGRAKRQEPKFPAGRVA